MLRLASWKVGSYEKIKYVLLLQLDYEMLDK